MHKFDVICLDRSTGNTLWRKTAREIAPHEGHHNTSNFAPSSPVTDGEKLYVSFGSRGLYCYDLNGNQLWSKDLGQMQIKNTFGEGASPAVHGNTLVVNWDHEGDSFIVALDASTGDQKWRQPRDEGSTWATPLIVSRNGRVQVITNGQNRCRSYDLATGELIWECGGQGPNPIPSPVLFEDKAILMTGFRTFQAYAIPLDATGDITDTDKIDWKLDDGTPYVSSPLLYGGTLYFTKERSGLMTSVDADTGQIKIRPQRLPNVNDLYASPVGAAEKVYFSSREGRTVVLKHAPELEVLAVNELDGPIDASPAIVGKEMFIRTATHLYCIAEAP
jgi:outer membrane protein assembly factor BamB